MFPSTFPGPLNHQLWNPDEKLVIEGVVVTFGFEAEFKCQHPNRVHDHRLGRADPSDPELLHVYNTDFPFLEEIGNIEALGNWEVKSKPYETLGECMRDMKTIKEFLRVGDGNTNELRSFHLHMRFPNSVTNGRFNDKNFRAWVSRIGDVILLWRIQYRSLRYTFENNSMMRRPIEKLKYRGTIRLTYMHRTYWDLELRGFMTARSQIRYIVCIICTAIAARSFHGFHDFQEKSTDVQQQLSLGEFLHRYNPSIDPENPVILELQNKSSLGYKSMHPVLYGFENAPYFSDIEKSVIVKANEMFAKDFQISSSYTREYRYWYYEHIQKWAKSINLHHLILCTLLRDPHRYSQTVSRGIGVETEVFVKGVFAHEAEKRRKWMIKLSQDYGKAGLKTVRAVYTGSKYHVWQIKPDSSIKPSESVSSLGSGYELVSPILFFDGHLDDLKTALTVCKDNTGGIVNRTCGLHVHVGIEGLSLSDLKQFSLNLLKFEMAIDLLFPPSRRNNAYCRSNLKSVLAEFSNQQRFSTLEEYIQAASSIAELSILMNPITRHNATTARAREVSRRYHKVNYQNMLKGQMSIEFRQHEGTISFDQTMMWIRFVIALIEVGSLSVADNASDSEKLEFLLLKLDAEERRKWIRHETVGDFLSYFRTRGHLPSAPPRNVLHQNYRDDIVYLNARETMSKWASISSENDGYTVLIHPDLIINECALFSVSFEVSGLQPSDYVELIAVTCSISTNHVEELLFIFPFQFSVSGAKMTAGNGYPRNLLLFKEKWNCINRQAGKIEVILNNLSEYAFVLFNNDVHRHRLFQTSRIQLGLRYKTRQSIDITRFEALYMISMRN